MADERPGDPTPRTLESLAHGIRLLEEKQNVRFEAYDEAVRLLQELANRQPTTEAVNENLLALDRLMESKFASLEKLVDTKFDGNKTALDAALKTQKEASDEIKVSFGKQYDNQSKNIDELKDRINRNDGKTLGLGAAGSLILGGCIVLSVLIAAASFIIARAP